LQTRLLSAAVVAILTTACSAPAGAPASASYDPGTGRLATLVTDTNGNGTPDSVSYMDGARIQRIELDLDENGHVERWDFYQPDGRLEKVGMSRQNDGVMDAQAFYDPSGELLRMELSTQRDGVFDRVEHYEGGVLAFSTDDTNRDGRPDKWDAYQTFGARGEPEYAITSTSLDLTGSGRPERRFVYGPGGTIDRVEVDLDGDGVFVAVRQ
jgi:hypothetical protein